jgi:hypothetical protein
VRPAPCVLGPKPHGAPLCSVSSFYALPCALVSARRGCVLVARYSSSSVRALFPACSSSPPAPDHGASPRRPLLSGTRSEFPLRLSWQPREAGFSSACPSPSAPSLLLSRLWIGLRAAAFLCSAMAALIDVQKARGPLARHEARVFSTTRARHDTSYSGPGLSPVRRACRARQPSRPVGLARSRPDIWWASKPACYKLQPQRPSHETGHRPHSAAQPQAPPAWIYRHRGRRQLAPPAYNPNPSF